jgi:peptidoglycan hydrolase CwlO-like protein
MWDKFSNFLSKVFFLTKAVEQQAKEIERLRGDVKALNETNRQLLSDLQQLVERQASTEKQLGLAFKNQQLELENKLLRLELRLSAGTTKQGDSDTTKDS